MSEKYNVTIPCYGHAGDGNLHATIIKSPDSTMEYWHKAEPLILREMYAYIVGTLGGKISGEHGIGLKRREYLRELISDNEAELYRSLKRAFDPLMIMNPGKIIV